METRKISVKVGYGINIVAVLALLLLAHCAVEFSWLRGYTLTVLMLCGINVILAVSLNVATGYLGQLPLGHAGFMAVGAYTAGIFLKKTPIATYLDQGDTLGAAPYIFMALVLAGCMAGLAGVLIGIPALRLRGDYLAIITLGFGEIIRVILQNIDGVLGFELTGGTSGLKRIPQFSSVFLVLLCVIITITAIFLLMSSRQGRAILAIRENEIAAESCGISTTYYKVLAFAVSAFFAGIAGALYAGYIGSLQPTSFGFMKSIEILVMVVLGGMGSMIGSVFSATVLTALPQILLVFSDYRMVAYSVVLLIMMNVRPKGLMGNYEFSMYRTLEFLFFREKKEKKKEGESS